MYNCNKCGSFKIKTRTNKSFGRSYSTPVECKSCGSTDIKQVEKKRRFNRR